MGYKLAGFDVVGANDIDPRMEKLYKANHHPKLFYRCPIGDLVKMEIPDALRDLDILDGSPPCSTFSMAGSREKAWKKDKKFREGQAKQVLSDLFFDFIALAVHLRPKVVIAENVAGMLFGNAKAYTKAVVGGFEKAGYDCQLFLLDASRMGVPQRRRRIFFVGRRKDLGLLPLKLKFQGEQTRFGSFRSADAKPAPKGAAKVLSFRQLRAKSIKDINLSLGRKGTGYTLPVVWDNDVCPTVTAGGGMYRGHDGKPFSDSDYVLAGSFPADYDFAGQSAKYVIGMSVPPVMMAQVAYAIATQMLKKQRNGKV